MPKVRLSRSAIDKLPYPGKQTIYWDTRLTGFGVRVNEHSRAWLVRVRVRGAEHQENLGRCDRVDIDIAYNQAKQIIEDAEQGYSPTDRRNEAAAIKQAAEAADTADQLRNISLQEILTRYVAHRKALKTSSANLYLEELTRYCPDWLPLPIRTITGDMIVERHARIGARGAPSRAESVCKIIRALCNFTIDMYEDEVIAKNPVKKLSRLDAWYNPGRRSTYLAPEDIKPWFNALLMVPRSIPRDVLLILFFTGARSGEVSGLTWDDVDLVEGTVLFRETKSGTPLTATWKK